eukprot:GEMP01042424.1.p1 GENE.GEMP01042424.1~~GEMP01042424.1.p1  ORF type:complete len:214 (+),score=18.91 GEMP01042424.1:60-644(+)
MESMDAVLVKDNIPYTLVQFGAGRDLIAVSQVLCATLRHFTHGWLSGLVLLAKQARYAIDKSFVAMDEAMFDKLERSFCEMWYLYDPDWKSQGTALVAEKGTWLKKSTRFSWECPRDEVMHYMPIMARLPYMKLSGVSDKVERHRHRYSKIHRRVWLHPQVVKELDNRLNCFYIYWPHWRTGRRRCHGICSRGK